MSTKAELTGRDAAGRRYSRKHRWVSATGREPWNIRCRICGAVIRWPTPRLGQALEIVRGRRSALIYTGSNGGIACYSPAEKFRAASHARLTTERPST